MSHWRDPEIVSSRMRTGLVSLGLIAVLISSCNRKSEIKVYRIAKAPLEESASGQGPAMGPGMPTNAQSPGELAAPAPIFTGTAVVPPNWEPQPPSQMRQASFMVKGDKGAVVDISLVSLGTSAANVLD